MNYDDICLLFYLFAINFMKRILFSGNEKLKK